MREQRQVAFGAVDPRVDGQAERRPHTVGEFVVEPDACCRGVHVELLGAGQEPTSHGHHVQASRVDAVTDLVVGGAGLARHRDERPPLVGVDGIGVDAERPQFLGGHAGSTVGSTVTRAIVQVSRDVHFGMPVPTVSTAPVRVGRLRPALVSAALAIALLLVACGGGSDSPAAETPPKPTGTLAGDATLLEGRTIYAKYCSSCHGVSGSGGPGTVFVGGRLLQTMPTAEEEAVLIRKGRAVMPSFGETLTPAQVDAVVRYTREVLAPRPAAGGS